MVRFARQAPADALCPLNAAGEKISTEAAFVPIGDTRSRSARCERKRPHLSWCRSDREQSRREAAAMPGGDWSLRLIGIIGRANSGRRLAILCYWCHRPTCDLTSSGKRTMLLTPRPSAKRSPEQTMAAQATG